MIAPDERDGPEIERDYEADDEAAATRAEEFQSHRSDMQIMEGIK